MFESMSNTVTPTGMGSGTGLKASWVLAEAVKAANRRPWRTLAVAVVAFAMCFSVLFTVGQAAGIERRVMAELESPAARLITVSWRPNVGGIPVEAVQRMTGLSHVSWVVGMSPAADVVNAAILGGNSCPAKAVIGELPGQPDLTATTAPGAVALVTAKSAACLGLMVPAGTISPASQQQTVIRENAIPIIGQMETTEALSFLADFVFIWQPEETDVAEIFLLADRAQDIPDIIEAALALVGAANASDVAVEFSAERLELNALLERELAANSQVITLSVLAAGLLFIGVTLTLSVGAQRRDFGRRRALGASRSLLITLVILEAVLPAFYGGIIGTAIGAIVLLGIHQVSPGFGFLAAVPILSLLAAIIGAIPAALTAALRDPVATLRVP